MSCILVNLPEQNEGTEGFYVCKVLTDNLEEVKKIILGKGLGVQGYDDGISISIREEFNSRDWPYAILELTIEQLASAVRDKELSWGKIIEWQRWGHGYVNEATKTIILHRNDLDISSYFRKCGYRIKYFPLPHGLSGMTL